LSYYTYPKPIGIHFYLAANKAASTVSVAAGIKNVFNSVIPGIFTGSQHLVPSVQREDSQTEERIAQILNEAQQAMHIKKAMEQVIQLINFNPKYLEWYSPCLDLEHTIQVCRGRRFKDISCGDPSVIGKTKIERGCRKLYKGLMVYSSDGLHFDKAKKKNTCVSCCMSNKNRVGR